MTRAEQARIVQKEWLVSAQEFGEAAIRIAMWEPCKGQVEYVGILAAKAAHNVRLAMPEFAEY